MFEKILIANRGEVASRILRTCRKLGVKGVAVFSEPDRRAPFVEQADEAVALGGTRADESYLVIDKILGAAEKTGCQAIHPGFGFLSENPEFAAAVVAAGLTFIGPPARAISLLGDKIASKQLAERVGVPVVSSDSRALSGVADARVAADKVGYPVLLKPAAGGGGKGMRVVQSPDQLDEALRASQAEARKAFADDRVFVERYVQPARHVEVQVLADTHGHVIHLGERECSVQRRHQKVLEEAPSPAVNAEMRAHLGELACRLAREAGYVNAGTVEFLLGPSGELFFMEMNTRLQVEHPVTEQVTGVDLVELQLRVASGERLPISQEDVQLRGWAIEARVCAEDPRQDFLPSTGIITRYIEPHGYNLRIDSGVTAGSQINIYYDSMLAKVIVTGSTREEARTGLVFALDGYLIEGPETNLNFLASVLNHPAFASANLSTDLLARHFANGQSDTAPSRETLRLMCIAAGLVYHSRMDLVRQSLRPMAAVVGGEHREVTTAQYVVKVRDDVFELELKGRPTDRLYKFWVDEREFQVKTPEFEFFRRRLRLEIDGRRYRFRLRYQGNFLEVAHDGVQRTFELYSPAEWKLAHFMPPPVADTHDDVLECPMPGAIVEVLVRPGERVYQRQPLVVIESMKMQSTISSPRDGTIAQVLTAVGRIVDAGETLLQFA